MIGGPALAAIGALRAGAGLVRLICPEPILNAAITICPSATGVAMPVGDDGSLVPHEATRAVDEALNACQCLAIGPALGTGDGARAAALRTATQDVHPVVIDADALNCLSSLPDLRGDFHAPAILTPHPGEFKRLAGALGLGDLDPVTSERRSDAAQSLARSLGCVVVLKGAVTVVADALRVWTDDSAPNSALSTAGTGDVLTGVIAGIVAQHFRPALPAGSRTITTEARGGVGLYDCARAGVRAHALAARAWADVGNRTGGMLAMELADLIPHAVESMRA